MLREILKPYILSIIPIFISIDIFGKIPLFTTLSEKLSHKQKKRVIRESFFYTLAITIVLVLIGWFILRLISISVSDFKIAGGILLFALSVRTIFFGESIEVPHTKKHIIDLGVLPLATPLILDPTLLIMTLIILNEFRIVPMLIALIANMFFSWLVLKDSEIINKLIGGIGIKSFSNFLKIILSAIAVMITRQGIIEAFFK